MTTTSTPVPGDTPTLRLRDPAGVVAAVPYLLGFEPHRSLVAVGVRDGAVAPVLRLDWEPTDSSRTTRAALSRVDEILRRNECSHALLVAWTELDPAELDVRGLRRALRLQAPSGSTADVSVPGVPVELLDVLVVGPTRFRSVRCTDRACCPAQGSPRSESTHHPVAAEFVLTGRAPCADRDGLAAPDATVTDEERAEAAAAALQAEGDAGTRGYDGHALLRDWCALVADGTAAPQPAFAGALAAAWTRDVRLRDACALACLPAGATGAPVLEASEASSALARALRDPGCADAVARHGRLYRRIAALVPERHRAVVLAGHAWLAWVSGEGTRAVLLGERALDLDPDCSLAALVVRCLEHGIGPEWTAVRAAPGGARRPARAGRISGAPHGSSQCDRPSPDGR